MEYTYVSDRYRNDGGVPIYDDLLEYDDERGFLGSYGDVSSQPVYMLYNAYIKECYYFNGGANVRNTNNDITKTVLPLSSKCTKWIACVPNSNGEYYSRYDKKWEQDPSTKQPRLVDGEWNVRVDTFEPQQQYVLHDRVRVYFQSGYVPEYEGFIFNIYTSNKERKYVNLLSHIFSNADSYTMTEPMWFADKLYSNYVEWRVPSIDQLTRDGGSDSVELSGWTQEDVPYDPSQPSNRESYPYYVSYGRGFKKSQSIGIDVYGVTDTETNFGFKQYNTVQITSTLIPNHDTDEHIVATINEVSDEGDYLELCTYYIDNPDIPEYDPMSLFKYLSNFTMATYTFIHTLSITERYVEGAGNNVSVFTQPPITYIQTWEELQQMYDSEEDESPIIRFRPIIEHAADMIGETCGATLNYTIRIMNNRDNTSIIRSAAYNLAEPRKYGKKMLRINTGAVNKINVYNRVAQNDAINLHQVTMPISTTEANTGVVQMRNYVTTSFIDRRNIKVTVRPVKVLDVEDVEGS